MKGLATRILQVFAGFSNSSRSQDILLQDWEVAQILNEAESEVSLVLRELEYLSYVIHWVDKQGGPFSLSENGREAITNQRNSTLDMTIHHLNKVGLIKCYIEITTPIENHKRIQELNDILREHFRLDS